MTYRIPGNAGTVNMYVSVYYTRRSAYIMRWQSPTCMVWRWRCSIGSLVFASPKRHVARRGLWWRFLLIKFESSSSSYTRLLLKRRKSRVDNFRPLNFYCHGCCVYRYTCDTDTGNYGGGGFTWLQPCDGLESMYIILLLSRTAIIPLLPNYFYGSDMSRFNSDGGFFPPDYYYHFKHWRSYPRDKHFWFEKQP